MLFETINIIIIIIIIDHSNLGGRFGNSHNGPSQARIISTLPPFRNCPQRQHDSVSYRVVLFSISSGNADSSEAMNSQLQSDWLEAHAVC